MDSRFHDMMLHAAYMASEFEMALGQSASTSRGSTLQLADIGHIELMSELVRYVEPMEDMVNIAYGIVGDYPGVFDYEVSGPFGLWFHGRIRDNDGQVPAWQDGLTFLRWQVSDFFIPDIRHAAERGEQPSAEAHQLDSQVKEALARCVTRYSVLDLMGGLPKPASVPMSAAEHGYRDDYKSDCDVVMALIDATNATIKNGPMRGVDICGVEYDFLDDPAFIIETVLVADRNWHPNAAKRLYQKLSDAGIINASRPGSSNRPRG